MKTKYLLLGIVTLLAVGGLWIGRAAWRAHRQIVSLDVRNAPLGDVLRKIEKQTRTKIRAEKALDGARITLRVANKPLRNVLARLGEQAGARWSTLYAVYDTSRALKALDSALRGDGRLEPAGWTKIAPNLAASDQPLPEETDSVSRANPNPGSSGPIGGRRGRGGAGRGPDSFGSSGPMSFEFSGPVGGQGGRQGGAIGVRRTKDGTVTYFGGPNGQVEVWSPEELVIASSLSARLGRERSPSATAEAAAETARKVKGKWTAFLAFKKSRIGVGFGGMPTEPPEPGGAMRPPNPNERFSNLTPGERVQRARQRLGLQGK